MLGHVLGSDQTKQHYDTHSSEFLSFQLRELWFPALVGLQSLSEQGRLPQRVLTLYGFQLSYLFNSLLLFSASRLFPRSAP